MKSFPLIFCLLNCVIVNAQDITISNLHQNIVYARVENPLSCSVSNHSSKLIELTTANGIITKGEHGNFTYHPDTTGPTSIIVWVTKKSKRIKIGTYPFRVKALPGPTALIGFQKSGSISVEKLLSMGGIRASFESDLDICATITVLSYEAIGISEKGYLFRFKNNRAKWDEVNKKQLEILKPDDTIFFHHIDCEMPDGSIMSANDIWLEIE